MLEISNLVTAYGKIDNGRLYLMFPGNLETNFNKFEVFIASGAAGGQNTLGTLPNNQGGFNNMAGLTFDTGFAATHWISMTTGGGPTQDSTTPASQKALIAAIADTTMSAPDTYDNQNASLRLDQRK